MNEEKGNLHKEEGALRIIEALSAVDEELLEQSGMSVAEAGEEKQDNRKVTHVSLRKRRTHAIGRYGRVAAACLALVVVGAVSWSGLRLAKMNSNDSSLSGSSGGGQTGAISNQETTQEMAAGGSMNTSSDGMTAGNTGAEAPESGANTNLQIITEEQARDSELGVYLPRLLPSGFSLESARTDDRGQLYLCWISGKDTILLSVTYVEAGEIETVDIRRPETYDVRLYELPYEETVPHEYWEIFNNPVFLEDDFSYETVSSRIKSCEDTGNTDTPAGKFGVLYPDGILVGFDGDGSAEDIWSMFASRQE